MRVFASPSFDHDRVAIEIVQDDPVFERQLWIDMASDARSRVPAVVIVDDDAAGDQPLPDPFRHIFSRLIDVYVDVAESELKVRNLGPGFFGEDAG